MMVANSHNLIVTVKPANQRNNVVHRGSKNTMGNYGSVGSAGSTSSAVSHDSPSPASLSNPITARYDMDGTERLVFAANLPKLIICLLGPGEKKRTHPFKIETQAPEINALHLEPDLLHKGRMTEQLMNLLWFKN